MRGTEVQPGEARSVTGTRLRLVVAAALLITASSAAAAVIGFEEFGGPPHSLGAESYYNGADGAGGFVSGGAFFNNYYTDWGGGAYSWAGWAVSNVTDNATPGYLNQYSAYPGSGADGSGFYAVAYVSTFDPLPIITLPPDASAMSARITNTTYAALAMKNGEPPAKRFGGDSGADPDWFRLTIEGLDENQTLVGSVELYLADYRFAEPSLDYILDAWTTVDLSSLSAARTLRFDLASSDVGAWGINTPTYFALDQLVLTPEPAFSVVAGATIGALFQRRRR